MELLILAFLVMLSVCLLILFLYRRKKKVKTPIRTYQNCIKVKYENGQAVAIYIPEQNATETTGKVWKCTPDGWSYSETGFSGPYMMALSSDFHVYGGTI